MLALLALLGWLLAGTQGLFWGTVLSVIVVTLGQEVSPPVILRIYGAVPLTVQETPLLHQIVKTLARRADLPVPPQLYYIPSQTMNAIAVGRRKAPAIGITDGLLRNLNGRELTGVLANEIGHFRNNDMRVMATADAISRITNLFSSLGIFMLFINIPLHLMGASTISWLAIMLLLITPTLSNLLQMALSRTREYNADRQAVQLTSDAHGLISALLKLEYYSVNILTTMLMPGHGTPDPSLFRTHPSTQERGCAVAHIGKFAQSAIAAGRRACRNAPATPAAGDPPPPMARAGDLVLIPGRRRGDAAARRRGDAETRRRGGAEVQGRTEKLFVLTIDRHRMPHTLA
jgi:heat shock protein HtpX